MHDTVPLFVWTWKRVIIVLPKSSGPRPFAHRLLILPCHACLPSQPVCLRISLLTQPVVAAAVDLYSLTL